MIFFKLKIGVTSHGLGPKLLNEDYLTNPTIGREVSGMGSMKSGISAALISIRAFGSLTGWFVTRTAMAGMISV